MSVHHTGEQDNSIGSKRGSIASRIRLRAFLLASLASGSFGALESLEE